MKENGENWELSHISAQERKVGEKGKLVLFHFAYRSSLYQKFTNLSIQIFIPSQQLYPLLVNIPENSSTQQKFTKSNKFEKLSATEDKNNRNKNADNFRVEFLK